MNIGIPKEIKVDEHRVASPPSGAREFVERGHTVFVESDAGLSSGFTNEEYIQAGAIIIESADALWSASDMIIKVKEPQPSEYRFLRPNLILFTYLHLAADEQLTLALLESGVTSIAYETVEDAHGGLPLLEPMSEVAGRMAAQVVSHYLERNQGGRGVLMGGVPGVAAAHVVILGAGTVGTNAAKIALGMGARVTLLDIDLDRLRYLDDVLPGNLTTLYSNHINIARSIQTADALIGSVLITGARAPMLVTRDMLPAMPAGSIIVTRPTTHSDPTFVIDGVLHYGVTNMPGAVPRTSSLALANATLPYAFKLASSGAAAALNADPALRKGLNTAAGRCTHPAVAETFGFEIVAAEHALDYLGADALLPL